MNLNCDWKLSNWPAADVASTVCGTVFKTVREQSPDLENDFPFKSGVNAQACFDDSWFAIFVEDAPGCRTCGTMSEQEIAELKSRICPFQLRTHSQLRELLGPTWFSSNKFSYVGPWNGTSACWPDLNRHLIDWLNEMVLPDVLKRNMTRILRAIPQPPQLNSSAIMDALWVLECEQSCKQGTAFSLLGVGLVTCQHALGPETKAFRHQSPTSKFRVSVIAQSETVDLAVLVIGTDLQAGLEAGSADSLKQMDHIAIAGFPNYRIGDTGVIIPGFVIGFRMNSVRRILTNANIIAGNSGGPVIDASNRVIGVAVTGADKMEHADQTENHGIIPVDALRILNATVPRACLDDSL
jgi:hypothetical protein